MPAYDFGSRGQAKPPRTSPLAQFLQLDLKGLDMVSPVDLMKSGRTPYAKNFRLYAQQADDRQVAVSNRKGSGFYMNPLGETKTLSQESVTGAATQSIGVVLNNVLEKFTAPNSNRLSRLDIKLANPGTGRGTVLVEIWSDNAGQPYRKLATSSIENGDISVSADYITARFIQAPKLTSGSTYWIVLKVQDDGADGYTVATTTNTALAYVSNTGVTSPVAQTFSINYKLYTTAENAIRGIYRWNRANGNNLTIVVIGTTMYYVDEVTHMLVSFKTGLPADASYYSFTDMDNKLFWANSYDPLTMWDGTVEANNSNIVTNGTFEVDASGWLKVTSQIGGGVARSTAQFRTGVASLAATKTDPNGITAGTIVNFEQDTTYHISLWLRVGTTGTVKVNVTNDEISSADVYPTLTQIGSNVSATSSGWTQFDLTYTPTSAYKYLVISGVNAVGTVYIDDVVIKKTGFGYITDAELPVLSQVTSHKDRLFGVVAADKSRFVWSESPGNPTATTDATTGAQTNTVASQQWYTPGRVRHSTTLQILTHLHLLQACNRSKIHSLYSRLTVSMFTQDTTQVALYFESPQDSLELYLLSLYVSQRTSCTLSVKMDSGSSMVRRIRRLANQ